MNSVLCRPLNLKLKGERNYLQGGDIYNAVNKLAPVISSCAEAYLCHLAFRAFCRNDADLYDKPPDSTLKVVGTGIIAVEKDKYKNIWIVESERPVVDRCSFDEERIISFATIKSKSIVLVHETVYSPIEDIIALTKALSYELKPMVKGKWVFGQLDIARPFLTDHHVISIDQKSAIAGRFTLNMIFQDDILIGEIRFIVGEP